MLRFAVFTSADLREADLSGADLQHVCFNRANLTKVNLCNATLDHAKLRVADLKQANLRGARLHLANLEAADLEGADLSGADLLHARLNEANLRGADLRSARLDHADFLNADLKGANLCGATLHHVKNLTRAQLQEARKSPSTILPPHLQPSRSSKRRRRPGLQSSAQPRTEANGVLRPAWSKRQAWIGGLAIAALFFVGIVWKPISRAVWLAQLEKSFGAPEQLSSLPAALSLGDAMSSGVPQIFAALPEADFKELTAVALPILRSKDFLPDPPPNSLSLVEGNRRAIAPHTAKLRELPPVAKLRKLRVRTIAKVPVDANLHRTLSNLGRGAIVIASYYGREFAGRRTASGERFNPSGMTAAHRTLPLGTRVQVTHTRNGRSVIVRINDRGPFIKGRSLDLSAGAAKAIGLGGLGRVHLHIVR